MTALLTCSGLDAGYGKHPVVRGFDLEVSAGEIVALLGPNGAGKTTLLLTMAGFLPALGGQVLIDGHRLSGGRAASATRRGVVLVPDDRSLFTTLTTKENLEVAQRRGGRSVDEIVDLFPRLGERLEVSAGMLSGGEQQMLAIGRALMQGPRILLIDELSMGLAPLVVESLLEALAEVVAGGVAGIVLVEQHVRLALQTADRGVVLVHGRTVLSGEAEELAADPERLERAYLGAGDVVGT